jgi:hypothetical protein
MKAQLRALRTDCITGETKETEIEIELTDKLFKITKGGCTGFEVWDVTPNFISQFLNNPEQKPFCACSGDVGYNYPHYDKLLIPAEEMNKIFTFVACGNFNDPPFCEDCTEEQQSFCQLHLQKT